MFWSTSLAPPNVKTHLETLLDSETYSLDEILSDELTLQEMRNGNKRLLDFLNEESTIMELLEGALLPQVDKRLPERDQYRRAYQCTEVLSLAEDEMCQKILNSDSLSRIITNFFDVASVNNLLVSFYAKIMTHLLDKQSLKLIDRLIHSDFLALCLKNMHYSACADLLHQLAVLRKDLDCWERVRLWYTGNKFADSLCSLMTIKENTMVHNSVSYLWCELVTSLRENSYHYREANVSDSLLESLQAKDVLSKLLTFMFLCPLVERSESVIANGAMIFITLLETSLIPNRPVYSMGFDEKTEQSRFGAEGAAGSDGCGDVWLPDPERIVESCGAEFVDSIVNTISDSIKMSESGEENEDACWFYLMQLLGQLLSTNCVATHQRIVEKFSAMAENPLNLLLRQVALHPLLTLYQVYLKRCILLILYTDPTPAPSPLIKYLLKDSGLIGLIISLYEDSLSEHLKPMCRKALRGFSLSLAMALHQSRIDSLNSALIGELINSSGECSGWEVLINGPAQKFEEENACMVSGVVLAKESMRGPVNIEDEAIEANSFEPQFEEVMAVVEKSVKSSVDSGTSDGHKTGTNSGRHVNKLHSEGIDQEIEEMRLLGFDTSLVSKAPHIRSEDCGTKKKMQKVPVKVAADPSLVSKAQEAIKEKESVETLKDVTSMSVHGSEDLKVDDNNLRVAEIDKILVSSSSKGFDIKEGCVMEARECANEEFSVLDEWPSSTEVSSNNLSDWADFTSKKADDWPPPQIECRWPGDAGLDSSWETVANDENFGFVREFPKEFTFSSSTVTDSTVKDVPSHSVTLPSEKIPSSSTNDAASSKSEK